MPKPKTPPAPEERPAAPATTAPPTAPPTAPRTDWPAADAPGAGPPVPPVAQSAAPPPGTRPVPGTVTAAAVLLFVMAILTGLFGALMLFAGAIGAVNWMWDPMMGRPLDRPGFEGALGMAQFFVIALSVILLAASTGHVVAGVGILRLRSWARVLGLVLAVFGLLVFGLNVLGSVIAFAQPLPSDIEPLAERAIFAARHGGTIFWLVMSAIFGGFYAFVLIVLMRRGDAFA